MFYWYLKGSSFIYITVFYCYVSQATELLTTLQIFILTFQVQCRTNFMNILMIFALCTLYCTFGDYLNGKF